jgi:uncharacterized protein
MDIQKLLHFCVSKLVENPDVVTISQVEANQKIVYEVRVAPQDLARVIGKEGRTFKTLRGLIQVVEPNVEHDLVVDAL